MSYVSKSSIEYAKSHFVETENGAQGGNSQSGGAGGIGNFENGGAGGAHGQAGDKTAQGNGTGGAAGSSPGANGGNGMTAGTGLGGTGGGGGADGNIFNTIGGNGGHGGDAGATGAASVGGGGGGSGGYGLVFASNIDTATGFTGGNGGNGGNGGLATAGSSTGGGGAGGGGGLGFQFISGSGLTLTNSADIFGGNGGRGGQGSTVQGTSAGGDGGNGGDGGAGVDAGTGNTIINSGLIRGGAGGQGGAGQGTGVAGDDGFYGVGIKGNSLTLTNTGEIAGGFDGAGNVVADAISFTGFSTLTLSAGGKQGFINGSIQVGGFLNIDPGTTAGHSVTLPNGLVSGLGGGSIDKIGAGTLILTGHNSYSGGTEVSAGVLDVIGAMAGNGTVSVATGAKFLLDASALHSGTSVTVESGGGPAHATLTGGYGNDSFGFYDAFNAADVINGNGGTNTLTLNGDYSSGVTIGSATLKNIQAIDLDSGFDYKLTAANSLLATGQTIKIDGSKLGSGDHLNFNGAAEKSGDFIVKGGAGNDTITTGGGADKIYAGTGKDVVSSGAGNDTISFTTGFGTTDKVNGGAGTNEVTLDGNYSGSHALVMNATTMTNVETLKFANGFDYSIKTASATVASGKTLTVNASGLSASHTLTFNGSAETNGHFVIEGGKDGDKLTGGALADKFVYTSALQSTSTKYDTINAFNFSNDKFNVAGSINAIDHGVSHALSTASFDAGLTAAVSGHLGAHSAMLVTASSGSLKGDVFLVIDQNGSAGYQTGHDLVIELHGATGTLHTSDFI